MNDEQTVEALNGMWSNYCVTDADGGDRYDLNNPRDLSGVYSKEEI